MIRAADLFCGGGGTSTALAMAVKELAAELGGEIDLDLVALNHWAIAVETHASNHPWATHICDSIENVSPKTVLQGQKLRILVGSPPCVFFSTARGGKPVNDQLRGTPNYILRWLDEAEPEDCLFENVPEFRNWGPLDETNRPIKARKGELFLAWIAEIEKRGYRVEYKVLNAADFGDPTRRLRLFIICRRNGKPIRWPKPTHSNPKKPIPGTLPWRSAREIIDWSLPGKSIWGRKRPLSPRTLSRIAEGFRRFGGPRMEPLARAIENGTGPVPLRELATTPEEIQEVLHFLVKFYGTSTTASLDEPLPTVTASGEHLGVCEARFTLGQQSGGAPRSLDDPLQTVCTDGAISLVEGILVGTGGPSRAGVLLTGPCQAHSRQNRRRRDDDPRLETTGNLAELIARVRPRFVVAENVDTISRHEVHRVEAAFRRMHYKTISMILNAAQYGSAQRRRRWIFVALEPGRKMRPLRTSPAETVREAFRRLPPDWRPRGHLSERLARRYADVPATGSYVANRTSPTRTNHWKSVVRLAWDGTSPAVTNVTKNYFLHPDENRRIEVEEALTLFGLWGDYRLSGNLASRGLQTANGVPAPLAHAVAQAIALEPQERAWTPRLDAYDAPASRTEAR